MTLPLASFVRVALVDVFPLADKLPENFRALLLDIGLLRSPTGGTATSPKDLIQRVAQGGRASLMLYPFEHGRSLTIGRKSTNDVVIADKRVSGVHAQLAPGVGPACRLIDMGSSNGTYLGDRCIAPGDGGYVNIVPGDVFLLADVPLTLLDRERLRALR